MGASKTKSPAAAFFIIVVRALGASPAGGLGYFIGEVILVVRALRAAASPSRAVLLVIVRALRATSFAAAVPVGVPSRRDAVPSALALVAAAARRKQTCRGRKRCRGPARCWKRRGREAQRVGGG